MAAQVFEFFPCPDDPLFPYQYRMTQQYMSYEEACSDYNMLSAHMQGQGVWFHLEERTIGYRFRYEESYQADEYIEREVIWGPDGSSSQVPPQYQRIRRINAYFIYCDQNVGRVVLRQRRCPACKTLMPFARKEQKLCDRCLYKHSYGYDAYQYRYRRYQGEGPSWGVELELKQNHTHGAMADSEGKRYQALLERLIKAGYLRTSDSTVDDEMVSPIYCLPFVPGNLRALFNDASEFTRSSHVGSHLNVSFPYMQYLNNAIFEVIAPLQDHLATHRRQTIQVWGRYFGEYRNFPTHGGHGSWLAVKGDRLEFRLAKLTGYQQYASLTKWLIKALARTSEQVLLAQRESRPTGPLGDTLLEDYIKTFGTSRSDATISMARYGDQSRDDEDENDDDDDDYRRDEDDDDDDDDNYRRDEDDDNYEPVVDDYTRTWRARSDGTPYYGMAEYLEFPPQVAEPVRAAPTQLDGIAYGPDDEQNVNYARMYPMLGWHYCGMCNRWHT
jgi:hypothetical protein